MIERLPPGITGFWSPDHGAPPPDTPIAHFKSACYAVAQATRSRIRSIWSSGEYAPTANYHVAQILVDRRSIYMLCNAHYPYIAYTEAVQFERTVFLDMPSLDQQLKVYDYTSLRSAYLHTHPNEPLLSLLDSAELKQISVWRPQHIGDIIFNQWD